jgi:hypothetical protein
MFNNIKGIVFQIFYNQNYFPHMFIVLLTVYSAVVLFNLPDTNSLSLQKM